MLLFEDSVHYDITKKVTLTCDASPHSIRAILSHKMPDGSNRLIVFALCIEKGYTQLEKKDFPVYFGKKSHLPVRLPIYLNN